MKSLKFQAFISSFYYELYIRISRGAAVSDKFTIPDVSRMGSTTSQRGRRVQALGLVLLDGLEEVRVRVEALPLVLPVVAGRDEEAAVLRQH